MCKAIQLPKYMGLAYSFTLCTVVGGYSLEGTAGVKLHKVVQVYIVIVVIILVISSNSSIIMLIVGVVIIEISPSHS